MENLIKAAQKMNKILNDCERDGDTFDQTLNKITAVKVHGVTFPTLMLMEIIDEFAKGHADRQKIRFDIHSTDEAALQKKYAEASAKWNDKLN